MKSVPADLKDVRMIALSGLTLIVNLLLQVPAVAAILAAVAVAVAFALFRRLYPAGAADAAAAAAPTAGGLSRREVEIARLVAEGMSNKEIGKRLFIAERTVDNHVQHILNKLGVHSRAQIAAWAAQYGLLAAGHVEGGR